MAREASLNADTLRNLGKYQSRIGLKPGNCVLQLNTFFLACVVYTSYMPAL